MTFLEVELPQQMIIDLRTPGQRFNDIHNIPNQTLNTELNVFKEKPELIAREYGKDLYWYSSVHRLATQDVIVHIGGNKESARLINFTFYNTSEPFRVTQIVTVDMKHFGLGWLARERRQLEDQTENDFIALMLPEGADENPCQLLKFTRNDVNSPWSDPPKIVPASHPDKRRTQVQNCYILEDGKILLVLGQLFKFFTPDLEVYKD